MLRLLALGHTNQEIAKMLYISVRTAETHRAHIMQKLRLSTRAELVRYALEHGLLDEARRTVVAASTVAFPNHGSERPRMLRRASVSQHSHMDELTQSSGASRAARSSPASSSSRRSASASPARVAGTRRRTTTGSSTRTSSPCTSVARAERLGGRPALVLELAVGGPLRIGQLGGVGVLIELAERIGAADRPPDRGRMSRIAVVVPLRPGAYEAARSSSRAARRSSSTTRPLDGHCVYLTEHEAVFVFEGPEAREVVEQLTGESSLWRAANEWRACLDGKPRVAETAFAWRKDPAAPFHVPGF